MPLPRCGAGAIRGRHARVKSLSGFEAKIVAAAADAMFPPGGAIAISGTDAGVVPYFDEMLAELGSKQRLLIRLLLVFVELVPVFFLQRARFSRQPLATRISTLAALADSPLFFLRTTFQSLRTLVGIGYLASEEVAAATGALPDLDPFARRDA